MPKGIAKALGRLWLRQSVGLALLFLPLEYIQPGSSGWALLSE